MATTQDIYPLFVEARKVLRENYEGWLAQCREEAKMGYRPSRCIHGTYLWVDYDCACYRCELDDRTEIQEARDLAHKWYQEDTRQFGKVSA